MRRDLPTAPFRALKIALRSAIFYAGTLALLTVAVALFPVATSSLSSRSMPESLVHVKPIQPAMEVAGSSDPNADFKRRCSAAGVVKCVAFDSVGEVSPFAYPDGSGQIRAALDTNVKASGSASLRFEIPPNSGANTSGGWTSSLGAAFGPGQTFYVQFRERFSNEFLKTN